MVASVLTVANSVAGMGRCTVAIAVEVAANAAAAVRKEAVEIRAAREEASCRGHSRCSQ
jgi:hypothetical protein